MHRPVLSDARKYQLGKAPAMNIRSQGMTAMTSSANHVKPDRHAVFESWGRTAYRRRRLILVIALLVAVLGGVWGRDGLA